MTPIKRKTTLDSIFNWVKKKIALRYFFGNVWGFVSSRPIPPRALPRCNLERLLLPQSLWPPHTTVATPTTCAPPNKVTKLVPESAIYAKLLELETHIDSVLVRKKIDVQEHLRNPRCIRRTLRIYVYNTFPKQVKVEPGKIDVDELSWVLRVWMTLHSSCVMLLSKGCLGRRRWNFLWLRRRYHNICHLRSLYTWQALRSTKRLMLLINWSLTP